MKTKFTVSVSHLYNEDCWASAGFEWNHEKARFEIADDFEGRWPSHLCGDYDAAVDKALEEAAKHLDLLDVPPADGCDYRVLAEVTDEEEGLAVTVIAENDDADLN